MKIVIGANIYTDGIKRNTTPLSLTGTFNLNAWYAPEANFGVQASLVYDDGIEGPLCDIQQYQLTAVTYSIEYQAVLDYASTNTITTPTTSQNLINDRIIRQHKSEDIWVNYDLFYYFKQDDATLYDFCTLNWKTPASHRLTNIGANPVEFVPGSGFKVTGGNSQYFNTQFNPSLHAVNASPEDSGLIFKIFGGATTYVNNLRVFGGASTSSNQINVSNSASGSMLSRVFSSTELSMGINQSLINTHFHIADKGSDKIISQGIGIESSGSVGENTIPSSLPNCELDVFGNYYLGTHYPSEGGFGLEYLAFGKSSGNYRESISTILNGTFNYVNNNFNPIVTNGTFAFDNLDVSLPSIYYPQVSLASKFPSLNTTKNYIVLFSTDHSTTGGEICWGEANNSDLSDFTKVGTIISGYQSETPHLELVPNDPNGEPVHLYYHPNSTHPDSGGKQQTRLLTRAGGDLHDAAGWTDRGPIFGIELTLFEEDHTGYPTIYPQADGSLIAMHVTKGGDGTTVDTIPKIGISSNSGTDYNWTRLTSEIDVTSFMPAGRQFHISPAYFFERNGIQYAVGRNTLYDSNNDVNTRIAIYRADGNYHPVKLIGNISNVGSGDCSTNARYFIDPNFPDVLNIYYVMKETKLYHTTWDLTKLDLNN